MSPGDAGSLARMLTDLARDPERRLRLGAEGRRTAAARFDRSRLGPELLEAYRRFRCGSAGSKSCGEEGLVKS